MVNFPKKIPLSASEMRYYAYGLVLGCGITGCVFVAFYPAQETPFSILLFVFFELIVFGALGVFGIQIALAVRKIAVCALGKATSFGIGFVATVLPLVLGELGERLDRQTLFGILILLAPTFAGFCMASIRCKYTE